MVYFVFQQRVQGKTERKKGDEGHYQSNKSPSPYSKALTKETTEATAIMATTEVAILALAADLGQWSWLYMVKSWGVRSTVTNE